MYVCIIARDKMSESSDRTRQILDLIKVSNVIWIIKMKLMKMN